MKIKNVWSHKFKEKEPYLNKCMRSVTISVKTKSRIYFGNNKTID